MTVAVVDRGTAITSELHHSSWKILDGETRGVKLKRNIIVSSVFSNRYKVLNQRRRNKDFVKIERTR